MPHPDDRIELRATDLLPPDEPPAEPQVKRIAERRVAGWMTVNRLMARNERRPAGNSRRFWKKIEDDDPFVPLPSTKRMAQSTHELYPSERLPRVEAARPKSKPKPAQQSRPQPKPRPKPTPSPRKTEPVHARDTKAARTPPPRPRESADEPAKSAVDRRPPRLPNPELKRRPRGRMSVGQSRQGQQPRPQAQPPPARSADEIRAAKQADREAEGPPPPPVQRGLDSVLAMLGELRVAETLYNQGVTGDTNADIVDEPRPRPKAAVKPAAKPTPRQEAPPAAREAPKPKPTAPKPPVNRSPTGAQGGGLDDLFGGPSEGRVRIGKRSKPKSSGSDQ